jgi:RNase P subunit RPR2
MSDDELRRRVERARDAAKRAAEKCERLRERVRLSCTECRLAWPDDPDARFRAYLTDDEAPEVVLFCRDCAEREFG